MKTLVTKRMVLRDLKIDDLGDLFSYAKKENIGPMAGWNPHKSLEESYKILRMLIKEQDVWGITIKPDDKLVGTIGLHLDTQGENVDRSKRELGYVLSDLYWGQGLTVEASFKVIEHGFNDLGLETIVCGHYDYNLQSKRVIEKLGFRYDHTKTMKDIYKNDVKTLMYKMTKEMFKELR